MSKKLNKKYQLILSQEFATARSATLMVLKPKPFSVWEVLIPIVFILGYMRTKEQRELFTQNLIFTKKLALGAALDMAKKNLTKQEIMAKIDKETNAIISNVDKDIYSEKIRKCQMDEIDFLIDHYQKLLEVDAEDYKSFIVSAYKTKNKYTKFLTGLKAVEKKVTSAACQTLGDKADTHTLIRLESAIDSIRQKETFDIFGMDRSSDAK